MASIGVPGGSDPTSSANRPSKNSSPLRRLAETTQSVFDPATQMPRTVRQATCKVPSWAGVLSTDQIRDSLTGNVYAVIDVITPPVLTSLAMGGPPDTLLTLRRITAVAP